MIAMTFEMAMAQALLNVRELHLQKTLAETYKWKDLTEMTYALRRLRVRAGLKP